MKIILTSARTRTDEANSLPIAVADRNPLDSRTIHPLFLLDPDFSGLQSKFHGNRALIMPRVARRTNLPLERMTPIKIRGKKGQKARLKALQAEKTQRAASEEPEMVPEPILSKLECLPTEILEKIFLFSQDVALPQASFTLGKVLSSAHVKHQLLRVAFADVCLQPCRFYLERLETRRVQSAILRCRWVDLASIKRAVSASISSLLATIFGNPSEVPVEETWNMKAMPKTIIGPGCPFQDTSISTTSRWVEDVYAASNGCDVWKWMPDANSPSGGNSKADAASDTDVNPQDNVCSKPFDGKISNTGPKLVITISRNPMMFELLQSDPGIILGDYRFSFEVACEIPTRLLHGPWTASKMEFLDFMMRAGAVLDLYNSNNGEVADQSLKEAIVQGNTSVVNLLLSNRSVSMSNQLCEMISVDHIRLAIFQGGCKEEIAGPIMDRACKDRLDLNKEDIVEWANERKVQGDVRGTWLLNKIDALEARGGAGPPRGFVDGCPGSV